ncbi:MAG: 2-phospho-L-lactate transferase [Nocardioides sp.]
MTDGGIDRGTDQRSPEPRRLRHNQPLTSIVVLSGGYGGAKFLRGIRRAAQEGIAGLGAHTDITAIVNTGDDIWLHGLRICPDLDTVMYTLGEGLDAERGWGRARETWSVADELEAYGVEGRWFGLGDRDLATHLVRTRLLAAGHSLSEATATLSARWKPGVRLLPMTDDAVETHIAIADPRAPDGRRLVHFQEYWVRLRAAPPALAVVPVGLTAAAPAPGVLDAIAQADLVVIPPSNPVVSVGPILGVAGIRRALADTAAPIVGVSPIVAGDHLRGMARQLLPAIGVEVSAAAVARHYGSRSAGGLLDGWLVDSADADAAAELTDAGLPAEAVGLMMHDDRATAAMVAAVVALATGPRDAEDGSR